jgi:hypothetical protein
MSSRSLSENGKVKICKTIIFPVFLYEFETWSLISRKEHRMRVPENRALRVIFGTKRVVIIGDWRRLHIEETHNLYLTPNIIRMIKSRRI